MTFFDFSVYLFSISLLAGVMGSLSGLGGGFIITPVLVLLFDIDIHHAMGASLIAVLATSSGSALAQGKSSYLNLRIGLLLEMTAVIFAVLGALLIHYISQSLLSIFFSFALFLSSYLSFRQRAPAHHPATAHPWANFLGLNGVSSHKNLQEAYQVQHVPTAMGIMSLAGLLAGLLGIGSGALKVLAMDQAMKLPYKVATSTSNFMVGITAAASAGIYFSHGYIHPALVFPVLLGGLIGAFAGAKLLKRLASTGLRYFFSVIVLLMGIQILYHGLQGLRI